MKAPAVIPALFVVLLLSGADWPQFLGPSRNGISAETGLRTTWPSAGPPLVWQRAVGAGFSGPVVVGERLVLFHRVGDEEVVECLHALNGQPLWKFSYPTAYVDDFGFDPGPRATPTVTGDRVVTLGAEGRLHCLDLTTGRKRWDRDLAKEYQPPKGFFGVGTSPLVERGRVFVNVGAKGAGVVAWDLETGRELWRATDQEASYSSPTVATIHGIRHVIFFTRSGILSLDPETGAERFSKRWRARINASVNAATPLVIGDLLFVSASYHTGAIVHRIRVDGIEEIWKGDGILSNHYNTSIHRDGFLYGIDGRQEGGAAQLRCVELATGKVRWTKERFSCASMILAAGHLYALNDLGELVVVEASPEAYREKARAAVLTAPCRAEIALANGRLYARDPKRLICLDLRQ
ncbi:MAG: PQQ-like beta-propeller repeat protein [Gemmataceae bacterium]|nr:PQQ-like beta-propeller repeat protein [Gemmataceae bacterium]MDW8266455.1 PQQ-binding-like beta-propeller repeat protein [Gemmataceae bacterium]